MKFRLIEKKEEARGTKSFFWQPDNPVKFLPGQYFYYTLSPLKYPDTRGATRHFTIASSPTENNFIEMTTRIREESGYKKTLDELPTGAEVEAQGPNGTFIFDEQVKDSQIFLAGGIGITPIRAFIKYNIDKNLKVPMYLIYSNSDAEFVFKKELDEWQKSNDFIKISYQDTSVSGHLDQLKIENIIENWSLKIENCTWWVVGPPPYIDAMEQALAKMKIPANKVRLEKFTGY